MMGGYGLEPVRRRRRQDRLGRLDIAEPCRSLLPAQMRLPGAGGVQAKHHAILPLDHWHEARPICGMTIAVKRVAKTLNEIEVGKIVIAWKHQRRRFKRGKPDFGLLKLPSPRTQGQVACDDDDIRLLAV